MREASIIIDSNRQGCKGAGEGCSKEACTKGGGGRRRRGKQMCALQCILFAEMRFCEGRIGRQRRRQRRRRRGSGSSGVSCQEQEGIQPRTQGTYIVLFVIFD